MVSPTTGEHMPPPQLETGQTSRPTAVATLERGGRSRGLTKTKIPETQPLSPIPNLSAILKKPSELPPTTTLEEISSINPTVKAIESESSKEAARILLAEQLLPFKVKEQSLFNKIFRHSKIKSVLRQEILTQLRKDFNEAVPIFTQEEISNPQIFATSDFAVLAEASPVAQELRAAERHLSYLRELKGSYGYDVGTPQYLQQEEEIAQVHIRIAELHEARDQEYIFAKGRLAEKAQAQQQSQLAKVEDLFARQYTEQTEGEETLMQGDANGLARYMMTYAESNGSYEAFTELNQQVDRLLASSEIFSEKELRDSVKGRVIEDAKLLHLIETNKERRAVLQTEEYIQARTDSDKTMTEYMVATLQNAPEETRANLESVLGGGEYAVVIPVDIFQKGKTKAMEHVITPGEELRENVGKYAPGVVAGAGAILVASGVGLPVVLTANVAVSVAKIPLNVERAWREADLLFEEVDHQMRVGNEPGTRWQAATFGIRKGATRVGRGAKSLVHEKTAISKAHGALDIAGGLVKTLVEVPGMGVRFFVGRNRKLSSIARRQSLLNPKIFTFTDEKDENLQIVKRSKNDPNYYQPSIRYNKKGDPRIIYRTPRVSTETVYKNAIIKPLEERTLSDITPVLLRIKEVEVADRMNRIRYLNKQDQQEEIQVKLASLKLLVTEWEEYNKGNGGQLRALHQRTIDIEAALEEVFEGHIKRDITMRKLLMAEKTVGEVGKAVGMYNLIVSPGLRIVAGIAHHEGTINLGKAFMDTLRANTIVRFLSPQTSLPANISHLPQAQKLIEGHDRGGNYVVIDGKKEYLSFLSAQAPEGFKEGLDNNSLLTGNGGKVTFNQIGNGLYDIKQWSIGVNGHSTVAREWIARLQSDGKTYNFYRSDDAQFQHPIRYLDSTHSMKTASTTDINTFTKTQDSLQELDPNMYVPNGEQIYIPGFGVVEINSLQGAKISVGDMQSNGQIPISGEYKGHTLSGYLHVDPKDPSKIDLYAPKGNKLMEFAVVDKAVAPVQVDDFASHLESSVNIQGSPQISADSLLLRKDDWGDVHIDPNLWKGIHIPQGHTGLYALDLGNGKHIFVQMDTHNGASDGNITFFGRTYDATIYTDKGIIKIDSKNGEQLQQLFRTYKYQAVEGQVDPTTGHVSDVKALSGQGFWEPRNAKVNAVDVHVAKGTIDQSILTQLETQGKPGGLPQGGIVDLPNENGFHSGAVLDITDINGNLVNDKYIAIVDPTHGLELEDTNTGQVIAYNIHYGQIHDLNNNSQSYFWYTSPKDGIAHAIPETDSSTLTAKLNDNADGLLQTDSNFDQNHVEIFLGNNRTSLYSLIEGKNGVYILVDKDGNVIASGNIHPATRFISRSLVLDGVNGYSGHLSVPLDKTQTIARIEVDNFTKQSGPDLGKIIEGVGEVAKEAAGPAEIGGSALAFGGGAWSGYQVGKGQVFKNRKETRKFLGGTLFGLTGTLISEIPAVASNSLVGLGLVSVGAGFALGVIAGKLRSRVGTARKTYKPFPSPYGSGGSAGGRRASRPKNTGTASTGGLGNTASGRFNRPGGGNSGTQSGRQTAGSASQTGQFSPGGGNTGAFNPNASSFKRPGGGTS